MPETTINFFAVLVAAVAAMAIGFLWYSPVLFGKQWMDLSGFTDKKMEEMKKRGMQKVYIISALSSVVMAYVLAHFVDYTQANSLGGGAVTGFWVWLGFVATTMITGVLYENKPVKLYAINTGYQLVSLLVMGALLATWM